MPAKLHVLLVDDDPASLNMIAAVLQQRVSKGNIVTASSAESGLEHVRTQNFDIVLCGVRNTQMTCLDFLRAVRQQKGDPVILVTASPGLSRLEALREGAYAFIDAPLEPTMLAGHIGGVIEKALLVRRLREVNAQSMKLPGSSL